MSHNSNTYDPNNNNPTNFYNNPTTNNTDSTTAMLYSSQPLSQPSQHQYGQNLSSEELYVDQHYSSRYGSTTPDHNSSSYPPAAFESVPTRLHNLTKVVTPTVRLNNQKRCSLPSGYIPGNRDVICGRGKKNWGHGGNVHFRNVIRWNVQRYIDAPTKNDKTLVVISLVDEIRAQGGRFLKEDLYGRWFDIGDAQARDKVGHSLRDQVSALNRQKGKGAMLGGGLGGVGGILRRGPKAGAGIISNDAPGSGSMDDFEEELSREDQSMDLVDVLEEDNADDDSPEPALERRNSIQSDSGNEVDGRRSSLFSSLLVHSFTRRPSFLAFSFGSRTSARHRASTLMGGDMHASKTLEQFRRSSNWEFLDSFDDMLEGMDIDGGGDANSGEPLDYNNSVGGPGNSLRLSANAMRALAGSAAFNHSLNFNNSLISSPNHPFQSVFDESDVQLKAEI